MYMISYENIGFKDSVGFIQKGEIIKFTKYIKYNKQCYCQHGRASYSVSKWNSSAIQFYTCECYLARYPTLVNTLWFCNSAKYNSTKSKFKIIRQPSYNSNYTKAIRYCKDERHTADVYLPNLFRYWNYTKLNENLTCIE